jgi:hypothetical protein
MCYPVQNVATTVIMVAVPAAFVLVQLVILCVKDDVISDYPLLSNVIVFAAFSFLPMFGDVVSGLIDFADRNGVRNSNTISTASTALGITAVCLSVFVLRRFFSKPDRTGHLVCVFVIERADAAHTCCWF